MIKKVYISGKMTGLLDLNVPKFKEAETRLIENGFHPVNPHSIHPADVSKYTWSDFMRADIKALMDCDMIAVLDDWSGSKGAKAEVWIGLILGMPVMCAHSLLVLEDLLPDEAEGTDTITLSHILKELKREKAMRKNVYKGMILSGKISEQEAKHRICIINKIILDYKAFKLVGSNTNVPSQSNLF